MEYLDRKRLLDLL